MPYVSANSIELFYELDGDPQGPAVLLVGGLGVQLISWPDPFVKALVDVGLRVIRYDNRDAGLSTMFDGEPANPHAVIEALLSGQEPEVAYHLSDMADDAASLLDALGVSSAHVIGSSMGGMIAQAIAIQHPQRVRSLTSIMSSTGNRDVGQPSDEAVAALLAPPAGATRAERIEQNVAAARIWASPDHWDPDAVRALAESLWDRTDGPQVEGPGRQLCAILASPIRDEALAALRVASLVIHGTSDALIHVSGGRRTAEVLPSARLVEISGMGHDLVPAFIPRIVAEIADLIAGVEHA